MLHQPPIGIAHVLRRVPGVPAVAAIAERRVTVDRPVDAEERAVAQYRETLLLGDRTAAGRSAEPDVAVRQRLPANLGGIAFGENVVAAQQHAFRRGEEPFAEAAHLMQR